MTFVEKRKRTPHARWPITFGRGFVAFALFYTALALLDIAIFFDIYGTIAGMVITFFWPAVCFSAFLGLQWNYYRTHGRPHHAQGIVYVLFGFAIMCVGFVAVVANGFNA